MKCRDYKDERCRRFSLSLSNIYLWGGRFCQELIRNDSFQGAEIFGIIDNDPPSKSFQGIPYYKPSEIDASRVDFLIVPIKNYHVCKAILNQLNELSFPVQKISFLFNEYQDDKVFHIIEQDDSVLENAFPALYKIRKRCQAWNENYSFFGCSFDFIDNDSLIGQGQLQDERLYYQDYLRYRTFELVAREIKNNGVKGNLAEMGVYKGTFSALINGVFPEKLLYLYDTFESFDLSEYNAQPVLSRVADGFLNSFKDTSEETVVRKMPYPEKCVIRTGFFPDSLKTEDYDEKFAFVSLDVDLEESTLSGLRFFYPRLSEGGYIFIHDYNDITLEGFVHSAIARYEKEIGSALKKVPLADVSGTLVITK